MKGLAIMNFLADPSHPWRPKTSPPPPTIKQEKPTSPHVINSRLTEDKIAASKIKRNKGFTVLVSNTWEKVLSKENDVLNNWINMHEVLVGSRAR